MRFMVTAKANKDPGAGVMLNGQLLMGKYNEELAKAGVLLAAEGLRTRTKVKKRSTPTMWVAVCKLRLDELVDRPLPELADRKFVLPTQPTQGDPTWPATSMDSFFLFPRKILMPTAAWHARQARSGGNTAPWNSGNASPTT